MRGLVIMDTPDYDPVAVTGQAAGGATLVAMTTGQCTAFGSLPAPTVKIASNSDTFARMADDIDLDCGPVLDGAVGAEEMGRRIFEAILRHASGEMRSAPIRPECCRSPCPSHSRPCSRSASSSTRWCTSTPR